MNVPDLIRELEDAGVHLWEDAGELRFRAPRGTLTDMRRSALRESKPDVVEYLRTRARSRLVEPHPADAHEPFPLTDVQAAYLLGRRDSFAYGGVGCHGYAELAFPSLDPSAVTAAWRTLIARHPMLRAVISDDGTQRVLPEVPAYRVAVVDLRAATTEEHRAALARTRAEMDHRVYRPDQWPLFDIRVTRGRESAILHFSLDLLISDFLSTHLLLAELQELLDHPDAVLQPIDLSFRDYVLAVANRRDDESRRAQGYWMERLDELPPPPDLPIESRRESAPHFTRWQVVVSPNQWAALSAAAAARAVTPSTAVLAAFVETLGRWCSRRQFTVNITLQQRARIHDHVERIVGDFTALELLAVDLDAGRTFLDRARAMQARLWNDLDHRWFSGTDVMRELSRRRGDLTMFPVVFTSSIGVETGTRRGLGDMVFGITQTPQVFIDCQAAESNGGLSVNWDVRDGVFADGVVDEMFSAFTALLTRTATDASVWAETNLIALPPVQAERRRLANATQSPLPDALLHEGIVARALEAPERPAVIAADGTCTYAELLGRALGVADVLSGAGVKPGDLVAIVLDKGLPQIVAVLGTLLCGGVYVPVDAQQPALRRNRVLEDAGARVALAHSSTTDTTSWPAAVTLVFADAIAALPLTRELPRRFVDADTPAYVIYTSGSTGTPKGVVISHRSAVNTIDDITRRFAIGASDRVLGVSSLGFDLSVYDIFGLLAAGGVLVLPDPARRADPSHWADLVATHRVTIWNSVPALMQMLQMYLAGEGSRRPDVTSLRLAMLSGDWIPVRLPEQVRALLPDVRMVSLGGATEAAIWSIVHDIEDVSPEWTSIPYGRPLANQQWHVLDRALNPCPDLVAGELYIGGAGLALGYWGDAARTAERFIHHPVSGDRLYRTGDWGRYRRDGSIEFLGRDDRQVKIRGHRIELAEIEAALSGHPAVAQSAVLVDGDRHDRRLCAFATLTPDAAAAATTTWSEEIRAFLSTRLPDYMVPPQIRMLDQLPITANGKVDVQRLRSLIPSPAASLSPSTERPLTDLEHRLAALWQEVLGVAGIRGDQGFLALGGDSLKAARLSGRLRQEIAEARHALFDELLQYLLADMTLEEFAARVSEAEQVRPSESPDRLVSLRTLVANGPRVVLLVAADAGELAPMPEWQSLWPDCTMLLAELASLAHLERIAPDARVSSIAEACVNALIDDGHLRVEVIGVDPCGTLALEVARQMTESGALVDRLFVVGGAAPTPSASLDAPTSATSDLVRRAVAAWEPAPYAGDVVVVQRPGTEPLADQDRNYWTTVCLGEVSVVYAGDATEA